MATPATPTVPRQRRQQQQNCGARRPLGAVGALAARTRRTAASRVREPAPAPAIVPTPLPARWATLDPLGFAILPDVLTPQECDATVEGIKRWFVQIGAHVGFGPGDGALWRPDNLPPHLHRGLYQRQRCAYIPEVLAVRWHPRVVAAFEELWRTDELVVSMDGINYTPAVEWTGQRLETDPRPRSARVTEARVEGSWYHFDQNPGKCDRVSVQALVNLYDVSAEDVTLCVLAGSHRYVADGSFERQFPSKSKTSDWRKLTDEEICWLISRPGVEEVFVNGPRGALFAWDSRTAHCVSRPALRTDPGTGAVVRPAQLVRTAPVDRAVVYVCMLPAANLTEAAYARRRAWIADRRVMNHLGTAVFSQDMRFAARTDDSFWLAAYAENLQVPTRRELCLLGLEPYPKDPRAAALLRQTWANERKDGLVHYANNPLVRASAKVHAYDASVAADLFGDKGGASAAGAKSSADDGDDEEEEEDGDDDDDDDRTVSVAPPKKARSRSPQPPPLPLQPSPPPPPAASPSPPLPLRRAVPAPRLVSEARRNLEACIKCRKYNANYHTAMMCSACKRAEEDAAPPEEARDADYYDRLARANAMRLANPNRFRTDAEWAVIIAEANAESERCARQKEEEERARRDRAAAGEDSDFDFF